MCNFRIVGAAEVTDCEKLCVQKMEALTNVSKMQQPFQTQETIHKREKKTSTKINQRITPLFITPIDLQKQPPVREHSWGSSDDDLESFMQMCNGAHCCLSVVTSSFPVVIF